MTNKNIILLVLFLISSNSFAQIIVNREDIKISTRDMDEVGEELFIKKNDSTLLPSNTYICNYTKRGETYPISFIINEAGKPDGVVELEGRFKTFVNNGIIYRYEKYQQSKDQLAREGFMRGDTVITKHYNKHGQLRAEYWNLNEKNIYDYNCSFYSETDSLSSCRLDDKVKGLLIYFRKGGQIESKISTKNLPKNILKQTEEFDENSKLKKKEIEYENGKTKTILANGSYTIITKVNGNENIEKYTKEGKLIRKFTETESSVDIDGY